MPHTFTAEQREKSIKTKQEPMLHDIIHNGSYRSNWLLKKAILEHKLFDYKCSSCNIETWQEQPISLELDHIDGDSTNCKLDNLRFLCPNCHSQTKTYKRRNMNSGKKKVSDEVLLASLRESDNIRQALIKVGLSPRGGNYTRAIKLKGG